MSLATNTYLGFVEEVAFGTTPASALQLVNVTGLTQAFSRDRQVQVPGFYTQDNRTYPSEVLQEGGGIGFETLRQFGNTDTQWEGLLGNDEGSLVSITGTDISVATNVLSQAASGLGSLDNGDFVYISGAGISPNVAGWYGPITSAGAGSVTFPAGQLSNFSAGSSVTIKTRRLIDGTAAKSYSGEWAATDAGSTTNKFKSATGIRWGTVAVKWTQGSFATETWTGMGKAPVPAAATIGTGSNTAAPTSNAMKCGANGVGKIWLAETTSAGLTAVTTCVISELTLTVQRNLGPYYGISSSGPAAIDLGNFAGTQVQATLRFDDAARAAVSSQIHSHKTMSIAWEVFDAQGNRELYSIPACRPDTGEENFGGVNDVRNVPVTFSVHDPAKDNTSFYKSSGFGYQVARFSVPAA
jgi:hypothetical protein